MFPRLTLFLAALPALAQVSVITYQYGNSRTGANLSESNLTPRNVNPAAFGKLFSYPVDGYIYAQPLVVTGVDIPGVGARNVVYAATEHDSVYAFDADTNAGAPLWHASFLSPGVTPVPASDTGCGQIVPEIGITGTPVIDPQTGTLYVAAMTRENGSYAARLHALDIATGAERPGSPVAISATVPGRGDGGATDVFEAAHYKQRPGLLLLDGVVYVAFSSHCDIGQYHGWLMGYDARTLRQVTIYNDTPDGSQGSFWDSGAAPAADASSNVYVVAGNGAFDYAMGGPDLGESYIKLSTSGGLSVAAYFTPFNYAALNRDDEDVGSAGVALLPDEAGSAAHPHLMTGAGKEGRIYLLDRDNPGGFQPNSDSQIVQSISGAIGPLFGISAYWNHSVYFCGSGDNLKAFAISAAHISTPPSSESAVTFGYPGCVPSISANGTSDGIVWAIDPVGILRAYDASNLASELYDSNRLPARDALGNAVKFSVPTVANGKVYAGTQSSLAVYGLLPRSRGALTTFPPGH